MDRNGKDFLESSTAGDRTRYILHKISFRSMRNCVLKLVWNPQVFFRFWLIGTGREWAFWARKLFRPWIFGGCLAVLSETLEILNSLHDSSESACAHSGEPLGDGRGVGVLVCYSTAQTEAATNILILLTIGSRCTVPFQTHVFLIDRYYTAVDSSKISTITWTLTAATTAQKAGGLSSLVLYRNTAGDRVRIV